jgi:Putative DNA-binding domain
MKILSKNEIGLILTERRFEDLVGVLEAEDIDFKDQPYQLSTEKQKYSLVEDIPAFANYEGGLIVMGCRTEKADTEGDVVVQIRPIQRDLINFETYRSLCNEFIYPPISGLKFLFYGGQSPIDHGLAVISVPKASEADRPHLITHTINTDAERKTTTRYALVTRTGSRNSAFPVQSLHGLIKIGASVSNFEPSLKFIEQQMVRTFSRWISTRPSPLRLKPTPGQSRPLATQPFR